MKSEPNATQDERNRKCSANYKYQNVYIGNWLIRPFAYKLSLD